MTGPKVGSSAMPRMSSCAFGRTIIGWMVTPAMRASGRAARADAMISAAAVRTDDSDARPSLTPPTSDLWTMSGDSILTTTGVPAVRNRLANAPASSASRARSVGTVGMA